MSRTIMNLEESRELEARCAVRMGLDTLMRRAGTFAAKWLDERLPCPHVTVLAGPGNNGGEPLSAPASSSASVTRCSSSCPAENPRLSSPAKCLPTGSPSAAP